MSALNQQILRQTDVYEVAHAYEKRVNPSFWDLLRSGKRRQEFNQSFGRLAVGMRAELGLETASMSTDERKNMAVIKAIEQKHQVEEIVAEELARNHPKRGKLATWFADKSPLTKGAIVGVGAFVSDLITGVGSGFMLNKLGRTNTDVHSELIIQSQQSTDTDLENTIINGDGSGFEFTNALKQALDGQAEKIREPLIADARAMAIGGAVGIFAGITLQVAAQGWVEAAEYAEALEAA